MTHRTGAGQPTWSLHHHLAPWVLVEAAHPALADAVIVHPICQEELYNPAREVSINPNENSILTPQRPVPDVRLGYTSTGQRTRWDADRVCVVGAAIRLAIGVRFVPSCEATPVSP